MNTKQTQEIVSPPGTRSDGVITTTTDRAMERAQYKQKLYEQSNTERQRALDEGKISEEFLSEFNVAKQRSQRIVDELPELQAAYAGVARQFVPKAVALLEQKKLSVARIKLITFAYGIDLGWSPQTIEHHWPKHILDPRKVKAGQERQKNGRQRKARYLENLKNSDQKSDQDRLIKISESGGIKRAGINEEGEITNREGMVVAGQISANTRSAETTLQRYHDSDIENFVEQAREHGVVLLRMPLTIELDEKETQLIVQAVKDGRQTKIKITDINKHRIIITSS